MVIELKSLMVKQLSNKGYTLVEMIFVLIIIITMTNFTIINIPDVSGLKFTYLKTMIQKAHLDSIVNHNKNIIEIYDSNLFINNKEYDLHPLICKDQYFYFNTSGNISNALTINCSSNYKSYEIRLQLGSGWLSYE